MRFAVITAMVVVALAGTAAAQPGLAAPLVPLPPLPPPRVELLDESMALTLSIGGTLASVAVFAGAVSTPRLDGPAQTVGTIAALGTVVAPTFGHWYAGSIVTRGLGARVLGLTSVLAGALVAQDDCSIDLERGEERCGSDASPAFVLAGVVLYVAGTLDDIVTLPGKVRRINRERMGIAVVPMLRSDGGGLAIAGRF